MSLFWSRNVFPIIIFLWYDLCAISKTNVIINLSIKNAKFFNWKINSTLASSTSILNSMYRYPGTYQCSNSGGCSHSAQSWDADGKLKPGLQYVLTHIWPLLRVQSCHKTLKLFSLIVPHFFDIECSQLRLTNNICTHFISWMTKIATWYDCHMVKSWI